MLEDPRVILIAPREALSPGRRGLGSVNDRMSRFTDIELTSQAPDGSWTWRAAGARQPRGTVSADLVPSEGRVGDVVRAELESALDGVEVLSIAAPKPVRRVDDRAQRIEVLGAPRSEPGVSISLARGTRLRDRDGASGPRSTAPVVMASTRPRRDGNTRPGATTPPSDDRSGRDDRPRRDDRPGRTAADGRPRRDDERRPRRPAAAAADGESRGTPDRARPRRDHRPTVSAVHRNAALASLRPEQLPVAEQLVRGGIPAVRQAIDEQNAAAKAAGQPSVAAAALLAMAEELLPVVNLAGWKDRAAAAQNAGRSMRLRELRAVVAASRTVSLDDEAKVLAEVAPGQPRPSGSTTCATSGRSGSREPLDVGQGAQRARGLGPATGEPHSVPGRFGGPPGPGGRRRHDRRDDRRAIGWPSWARCSNRRSAGP